MKTASLKELKLEIEHNPGSQMEMLLRLAKFKKENKELLTYLLFYNNNENSYVADIKESLHLLFTDVNVKSYYITKKNLRKILRLSNKFIRYSPNLATEVDILIYIADEILQLNLNLSKSAALQNLYNNLIKRIEKKINDLHEDLQYDFNKQLSLLIPQKK